VTRPDIRRMAPYRRERHQNTESMPPAGKFGQRESLDKSYFTAARDILVTLRAHRDPALDSQGIADVPLVEQFLLSSELVSICYLIGP
jgi:hypothetical protein